MNPWIFLLGAGFFEIGFTTFMKLSNGFSVWRHNLLFIICAIFSFQLLSMAMKSIPLGTAYAVWTSIGAMGTAIVGMAYFQDPATWQRILFLGMILTGVIGLKISS